MDSEGSQPNTKTMEMDSVLDELTANIESNNQIGKNLPPASSITQPDSNETSKLPIIEETNPTVSSLDADNDYIEPESPTGADALIYDDDESDDEANNPNISPESVTMHSHVETLPVQQTTRADYNPLKAKNAATSS